MRTFLFARNSTTGVSFFFIDLKVVFSSKGGSLFGPFRDHAGSTVVEPAAGSHADVEGRGPGTLLRFNGAVSLGGGLACFWLRNNLYLSTRRCSSSDDKAWMT
jgi:hypothetical protein